MGAEEIRARCIPALDVRVKNSTIRNLKVRVYSADKPEAVKKLGECGLTDICRGDLHTAAARNEVFVSQGYDGRPKALYVNVSARGVQGMHTFISAFDCYITSQLKIFI